MVSLAVVDNVSSEDVRIVSGFPKGSALSPLLFLLYTGDLALILENSLVIYADDSTLLAEVPKPSNKSVSCIIS